MHRLFVAIAGILPPKDVTERLAPFATLSVALVAGFWAFFQYSQQLAIDSVKTSFDMNRQYIATFGPEGVLGRLPLLADQDALEARMVLVQCSFLVGAKLFEPPQNGCAALGEDQKAAMATVTSAMDETHRSALRDAIAAEQATFPWTQEDAMDIDALLGFFTAVAVCIDQRTCDPDVTLALFQREIIPFLNATCGLLARDAVQRFNAEGIARVIRDVQGAAAPQWSQDKKRSQQFMCNWLRV
jgi:hypothetical protein